jgi:hypothetical protein
MPRGVTYSSYPPHLALMTGEVPARQTFLFSALSRNGIGSFWIKPTAKHITNTKTNKY